MIYVLSLVRSLIALYKECWFAGSTMDVISCKMSIGSSFRSALAIEVRCFSSPDSVELSGGENQRISIARAILKDAPIIILDEATSSVDPENQHALLTAINELTCGKTLIIIAHRLSTIKDADQIIVLDNGHVVQQGTHETLLQQDGIYRRFVKMRQTASSWKL